MRPDKSPWDVQKYSEDETFNEVINVMIFNSVFGLVLAVIAIFIWSSIPLKIFEIWIRFRGDDLKSLTYFLQKAKEGSRQGLTKGFSGLISKVYPNLLVFWKWVQLDREMLLQSCNLSGYQVSSNHFMMASKF